MNKKNTHARNMLRNSVDDGYSHVKHFMLNTLIALGPIIFFVAMLTFYTLTWHMLLMIPVGILFGNLIEYMAHRYPMHHPQAFGGKVMFKRHTGEHHRAFAHNFMEIEDPRDYGFVMLPTNVAFIFMLILFGVVSITSLLIGAHMAAIMGITLSLYFFVEEMLHLSFHFSSTWKGNRWYNKFLRRLGKRHRVHHKLKKMSKWNFNIAFPIMDYMFGTALNELTIHDIV